MVGWSQDIRDMMCLVTGFEFDGRERILALLDLPRIGSSDAQELALFVISILWTTLMVQVAAKI